MSWAEIDDDTKFLIFTEHGLVGDSPSRKLIKILNNTD